MYFVLVPKGKIFKKKKKTSVPKTSVRLKMELNEISKCSVNKITFHGVLIYDTIAIAHFEYRSIYRNICQQ